MASHMVHNDATNGKLLNDDTDSELRFNRKLWRRFRDIAQPYFYPREEGSVHWFLLLLALLFGVVSGTYWLAFIGLSTLPLLVPAHMVPSSVPKKAAELGAMPWPLLAAGCLAVAVVIAYRHRKHMKGRWSQWALLSLLLFLLFCVTGLNVYLSFVFRGVDNQLVARDEEGFYSAMFGYGLALVVAVPIIGLYRFVRMTLARNWRQFLCDFFLDRYLANRAYYNLDSNSDGSGIDNPDQRLTQDVEYFTTETLSFLLDILGGILDLVSFAAILWITSRRLMGSLIAYAGVGTVIAGALGQRLVEINYKQLQREADLRYSLIHVRDNAEAIAFYSGEALEGVAVRRRLSLAMDNQARLIKWSVCVTLYQRMFSYLARLVPYLVIGGLYFAKQVDFGTVGQGAFAFSMVLHSVSLIIDRIGDISRFSAGINRLGALYDATDSPGSVRLMDNAGKPIGNQDEEMQNLMEEAQTSQIHTQIVSGTSVSMANVTVETPTGRILVRNLSFALDTTLVDFDDTGFRRLLIVGPSGFGKSSVLRAVAGLWRRGSGEIKRPPVGDMIFLPQKPYMPLGDLKTQLLYPHILADVSDKELVETLAHLKLGDLPERFPGGFNSVQDWSRVLSGGEQQRLAAARCLVTTPAPTLIVLDEATSALPIKDEGNLYRLFCDRGLGYISVGHRESLIDYHDMVLEIQGGGSWKLWPPQEYRGTAGDRGSSESGGCSAAHQTPPVGQRSLSNSQLRRRESPKYSSA